MTCKTCPFKYFDEDVCCTPDCVFYDDKAYCVLRRAAVALARWAEAQP